MQKVINYFKRMKRMKEERERERRHQGDGGDECVSSRERVENSMLPARGVVDLVPPAPRPQIGEYSCNLHLHE